MQIERKRKITLPTRFMVRLPIRSRWAVVLAVSILVVFVLAAIFPEYLAPHSPRGINLAISFTPPFFQEGGTTENLLGTDQLGRDILSRIIYGARTALLVAAIGIFFAGVIGTTLGIIAGYRGGWVDTVISRAVDMMLALPTILLAMVLAIAFGASLLNVAIIVTLVYWARYARISRGGTLQIRTMDYVTLARVAGTSKLNIILRHILPNLISSLIVLATFEVGTVITLESTLSFLGVGVPPPAPSWGGMCSDGRDYITSAWWVSFMPGVAIMLVVLACNLLGDWVRDRLDPKLRDL
jgi:peptide/nickel transport system permease protein